MFVHFIFRNSELLPKKKKKNSPCINLERLGLNMGIQSLMGSDKNMWQFGTRQARGQ